MTTQAVVTDKNNTVVVESKQQVVVLSGPIGPQKVIGGIADLSDIDISNLQNGGILIYNTTTQKWTAGNLLNQQVIESGQY
jgi:hypothetical protein